MRRLSIFVFVLTLVAGCASDGEPGPWDEFRKDLRGDNMKMRMRFEDGPEGMNDRPWLTKPHD